MNISPCTCSHTPSDQDLQNLGPVGLLVVPAIKGAAGATGAHFANKALNRGKKLQNLTMWGGSVMNDVAAYTEGMDNAYGMPDVMLQNMQFGEIAVPVGAAIAGGIASGAAGAAFNHVF